MRNDATATLPHSRRAAPSRPACPRRASARMVPKNSLSTECGSNSCSKNNSNSGTSADGDRAGYRFALYPDLEAALNAWIAEQPDPKPSKPEAIRCILRRTLC